MTNRLSETKGLKFADLFAVPIRNGLFRPTYVRGEGTKMINMGEVFSQGRIGDIDMELVPLAESERENFLLRKNDLLFARASLTEGAGKCCIFVGDEEATFESHVIRVRLNPKLADSRFYYYYFNSSAGKQLIETIVERTTASGIRTSDLLKLMIPYPEIDVQTRIADFFELMDRKIELNEHMNKTIEAMALAIFKHWFVDFEFPNEEGEPYKSSGGEMVDSELGEAPEGWRISRIGAEAEIGGGTTPDTSDSRYWDSGKFHWATPKDLSDLSASILLDTKRKITDLGLATIGGRLYPEGVLLLSSRAPIGYLAISEVPTSINQGIIAIVAEKTVSNYYMLGWCRINSEEIKNRANGTTFLEISKSSFREMPMLVPPQHIIEKYSQLSKALFSLISSNSRESHTLLELRDSLLPKLMSGKIRVPLEAR